MSSVWSRKSRRMLIERVGMYVSAGMPIDVAVLYAGKGLSKKQLSSLEKVRIRIEGGYLVSSLFIDELKYPPSVAGIISCGESSGNLAQAFIRGHALLEREDELVKKCMSALTYPIVIAIAATVLIIGLVRGVMPQIIPLLIGLHANLPLLTKIVMRASDFLINYGIITVVIIIILSTTSLILYRKFFFMRKIVQESIIHIPLVGSLVDKYSLAVFFQSMGALTESGMPADVAYGKAVFAIDLIPLKGRLTKTVEGVVRGGSFGEIFTKKFPAYIAPLIMAGEASGNLSASFTRSANILDRELEHSLKNLTGLIEPVMMVFVGLMVGAIALSIMMPIYDISKNLQH